MAITISNHQTTRTTANATSATLASYTPAAGSDRILVVRAAGIRTAETAYTFSATFGGVAMTQAVTMPATSVSRYYRTSIFYLVAPSGSAGHIEVTASATIGGFVISAVTLVGAKQASPLGATDTDAVDNSTEVTSYGLTGTSAGSVILAVVASNTDDLPLWTWATATEDFDLNGTADSGEIAASGGRYVTAGGSVTVTATRSSTIGAQAGCAAEFLAAGAGLPVKAFYYARLRAD